MENYFENFRGRKKIPRCIYIYFHLQKKLNDIVEKMCNPCMIYIICCEEKRKFENTFQKEHTISKDSTNQFLSLFRLIISLLLLLFVISKLMTTVV